MASVDDGAAGPLYPATPAENLPASFNPVGLVHELYRGLCPHDADQGQGSYIFNEPAYTCSRCIETAITRGFLIGVARGRTETRKDERHAS